MTWILLGYAALGYYHFRLTLRHLQPYDTVDTALLNAALALTIGPFLLVPAIIVGGTHRWISSIGHR